MFEKSSTSAGAAGKLKRAALALGLASLIGSSAAGLESGDTPPPIDLSDQHGEKVDLAALRGRVVLVDFWASWCPPCKKAMPLLQSLHEKYQERGLVVVGVNIDNNRKKMDKFLKGTPVTFRIVHDPKASLAERYELSTMPTTFFIGRDGKVRGVHPGFRHEDAEEIEQRIRALLAEGN